jgi:hypothetical protein
LPNINRQTAIRRGKARAKKLTKEQRTAIGRMGGLASAKARKRREE